MRAAGAEVEIPSVSDAKDKFDAWLFSTPTNVMSGETMIRRALGLSER